MSAEQKPKKCCQTVKVMRYVFQCQLPEGHDGKHVNEECTWDLHFSADRIRAMQVAIRETIRIPGFFDPPKEDEALT